MTDEDGFLAHLLRRTVAGDLRHFDTILKSDHEDIRAAAAERLRVERNGLLDVLNAWGRGELADAQVQAWASFIRRGYVASRDLRPLRPIDIEYDPAWEELIVEVLARLEALGDLVDGNVSDDERGSMVEALRR